MTSRRNWFGWDTVGGWRLIVGTRYITVTLTEVERDTIITALGYYETVLEDERDGEPIPEHHPFHRAWMKLMEKARPRAGGTRSRAFDVISTDAQTA